MARRIVFWISVAASAGAAVFTIKGALWLRVADAPELVAPLLTWVIGGAAIFALAVGAAIFTRPRSRG